MQIKKNSTTIVWDGRTHYAYCFDKFGHMIDMFSFAWEKNTPSQLDFTDAANNFFGYLEEEYANTN
jgi:hypothetical protein